MYVYAHTQGYGVIRDVLQNHLTQVLCLLKMDLPHDDEINVFGSHEHRSSVLKSLTITGGDAESKATSK